MTDEALGPLIQRIKQVVPGAGVFTYRWTGCNSARARFKAADRLTADVKQLHKIHPNSRIVGIGHSHGGNLLAWAANEPDTPLNTAVYLNTPFIHLLPGGTTGIPLVLAAVFSLVVSIFPAALLSVFENVHGIGVVLAAAIIAGLLFAVLYVLPVRSSYGIKLFQRLQEYSQAERYVRNELAVVAAGDEVAALFGTLYAVRLLQDWMKRFVSLLIPAGLLLVLATGLGWPRFKYFADIGAFAIFACVVLYSALCIFAHGFVQGLIAMHSNIAIIPSPIGIDKFVVLDLKEDPAGYHSALLRYAPAILSLLNLESRFETEGFLSAEMPRFEHAIETRYSKKVALAAEVNQLSHRVIYSVTPHNENPPDLMLAALLTRQAGSFQGCLMLLRKGLATQAQILLRNLAELTFVTGAIKRDETFLEKYVLSEEITRVRSLEAIARDKQRRGENVDQKTTELIEALRLKIKTENILKLTTEKIAETAGLSSYYDTLYRFASMAAHASPRDLNSALDVDADGAVVSVRYEPEVEELDIYFDYCISLMLYALHEVASHFGVYLVDEIEELQEVNRKLAGPPTDK